MKLTITDIAVTERFVEIPATCPNDKCGADLTQPDALKIAEYIDATYLGSLTADNECGYDYGESGFDWHGEDNITGTAFYCRACSTTIAEGTRTGG